MLRMKRIYETVDDEADGRRVLVDRIWPRGMKKADAHIDEWLKTITPSPALRKWYHSDAGDFDRFSQAYRKELVEDAEAQAACQQVLDWQANETVTLLYAAKNTEENHVVVLMDYLNDLAKERS